MGMVPRRVSYRIKYHNLWLARLLQDDLSFLHHEDRMPPRVACMREGGYLKLKPRVIFLALFLGAGWNSLAIWLVWISGLIPDEVKQQTVGLLGLGG